MAKTYPEHDALRRVQPQSQAIHEFMEWVGTEKRLCLAGYADVEERSNRLFPTTKNLTDLVAEFLEIDLKKLENEKLQTIDEMRKASSSA